MLSVTVHVGKTKAVLMLMFCIVGMQTERVVTPFAPPPFPLALITVVIVFVIHSDCDPWNTGYMSR